jgi:hypothetical protein
LCLHIVTLAPFGWRHYVKGFRANRNPLLITLLFGNSCSLTMRIQYLKNSTRFIEWPNINRDLSPKLPGFLFQKQLVEYSVSTILLTTIGTWHTCVHCQILPANHLYLPSQFGSPTKCSILYLYMLVGNRAYIIDICYTTILHGLMQRAEVNLHAVSLFDDRERATKTSSRKNQEDAE